MATALSTDDVDRLDLKIATAALTEMRDAFRVFAPYQDVPKVTIFGSARTRPDDPVYEQARRVAADLAEQGWMVVTGAGPGIMAAGMEGAGRERSIGVSIRLPWEQGANSIIAGDHKYVSMKYFFTRKLMLIKESKAFVCLPGGFGTLDETYELLTLTQTGKGLPVPIVFLDTPGDTYWRSIATFIDDELVSRGLVGDGRRTAVPRHRRLRGGRARDPALLRQLPVAALRRRRAGHPRAPGPGRGAARRAQRPLRPPLPRGRIERSAPLSVELKERDAVDLARLRFTFARHGFAQLRGLIDALNDLSAPA